MGAVKSSRVATLLVLILLSPAFFGGLDWNKDTIPATVADPSESSILTACNNEEILRKENSEDLENRWIPSTSAECAPKSNGTLVLTLDDQSHLPSWWTYRQQFLDLEMRLTFFIDRSYHLNETEWYWLQTFQSDGHEIGVHGKNHLSVIDYIENTGSIQQYITDEIIPEIEAFNEHGIYPTSFAYPHGLRTDQTDDELLKHFRILRATEKQIVNRNLPLHISEFANQVITAGATDREYDSRTYIEGLIHEAARSGKAFTTYGHRLDPNDNPYHTTEPEDFIAFATLAKSLGMRFGTVSELARPAHQEGLEQMYAFIGQGEIEIANRMLENCWTLPRFDEVCLEGDFPKWNEDPYDENYWRFVFYSLRPLKHLLYAWKETQNVTYRDHMLDLVSSFSDADDSSPWIYVHHADKHGAAFRAMVLTEIRWTLAHDYAINSEEVQMLESLIHKTATYLMHPANFESGYNHGFNQAAGLLAISTNHPWLQDSLIWDQTARIRLNQMMQGAVDSDGVMIESSTFYHNYILLKVGEIISWGEKNEIVLPESVSEKFPLMLDYATDVAYPDLKLPLIGASNPTAGLNSKSFEPFEVLHPRLAWIRSNGEEGHPGVANPELFHTAIYPESGHTMLRSSWLNDLQNVSHVVLDAGPYRTSHSDFDHFGMTWFKNQPILIDPGLYSYEDSEKRDYFHGTSAHNVVLIDLSDQPETYTIGQTWVFEDEHWGAVISSISIDDWTWTRAVVCIGNDTLLVYDQIDSTKQHRFDLLWHLSADLNVQHSATGFSVMDSEQNYIAQLQTMSTRSLNEQIILGQEQPMQGWFADHYESMIPAPVIQQTANGDDFIAVSLWSTSELQSTMDGDLSFDHSSLNIQVSESENTVNIERGNDGIWTIEVDST